MTRARAVLADRTETADTCVRILEHEGFEVSTATHGDGAVELVGRLRPELTVLDIGLVDPDGFEVCRRVRQFHHGYLVLLSDRSTEADKVRGFVLGADDYLVRPYSEREFAMRVRALRRRPLAPAASAGPAASAEPPAEDDLVRTAERLRIDAESREVILDGAPVELTKLEFELLQTLARSPRRTFTRTQLLHSVWGDDWYGDDHVIDVHVGNLRRKLGESASAPRHLRTVRGVGYRFEAA
jgi:DNA-binding response OmpR family regulator